MVKPVKIICAGLIGWDSIGRTQQVMHSGADLPGVIETNIGGVIANIALSLALSDIARDKKALEVILLSSVGDDQKSNLLLSILSNKNNINCDYVIKQKGSTDGYIAIESEGELWGAVASSYQLEKSCCKIFQRFMDEYQKDRDIISTNYFIVDSNLTNETLNYLTFDPIFDKVYFIIACASTYKAKKIRSLLIKRRCTIYANLAEASELVGRPLVCSSEAASLLFNLGARQAIVTNGANKASSKSAFGLGTLVPEKISGVKVTGAGDIFLAAHFMSTIFDSKLSQHEHLKIAGAAAKKKISLS